jgi:hypothetical protein
LVATFGSFDLQPAKPLSVMIVAAARVMIVEFLTCMFAPSLARPRALARTSLRR